MTEQMLRCVPPEGTSRVVVKYVRETKKSIDVIGEFVVVPDALEEAPPKDWREQLHELHLEIDRLKEQVRNGRPSEKYQEGIWNFADGEWCYLGDRDSAVIIQGLRKTIRELMEQVKKEHDRAEYNAHCAGKNAEEVFKVVGQKLRKETV